MRFSRSRRRPDWPLEAAATKLAAEAEAWTNGELADLRAGRREESLAPWLILNRVAHADLPALHRARREASTRPPRLRGRRWASAEQCVVQQVLATAASSDDLARLQRRVLVPLELHLVERSKATTLTLDEVLTTTTAAVARTRPAP